MWPFKKKSIHHELHPLISQFSSIVSNPRCLEWFERVANGHGNQLPIDVGLEVQEAINLSYTNTSMSGKSSLQLIACAKKNDFSSINILMQKTGNRLNEKAVDSSRVFSRIIEWANDHKIPNLQKWDATFYKQAGIPRDIKSLNNLRFILIMDDHGITEIPAEISKLPILQGLCITGNKISSIPEQIYQSPSLQRLDLEDNDIRRVEAGIHKLKNVYAIDLSGNKLEYITPDIAKMPSLTKIDIRNQRTPIDIMRAADTPLPEECLDALYRLESRIEMKY
jgi:Leucine-rich repeat (LRR) protein